MLADSACVSLASKASHSDSSSVTFVTIRLGDLRNHRNELSDLP